MLINYHSVKVPPKAEQFVEFDSFFGRAKNTNMYTALSTAFLCGAFVSRGAKRSKAM